MRRLLLGDVIHLATALAAREPSSRAATLGQWIDQTRAAAKYHRRFGRAHRDWGDGSLTSRALLAGPRGVRAETLVQRDFLAALAQVSGVLAGNRQLDGQ